MLQRSLRHHSGAGAVNQLLRIAESRLLVAGFALKTVTPLLPSPRIDYGQRWELNSHVVWLNSRTVSTILQEAPLHNQATCELCFPKESK